VQGICTAVASDPFTSCTDHVWDYNPLASLSYSLGKSETLFATFAEKSRFPTLKDRYSFKFGRALPDPALKPEHAGNWSLGYSRAFVSRTVAQVELFRSDVRDAIENIIFPSPLCTAMKGFCMQAANIGKEVRQGAEFSIRSTPIARLTLDANYGFLNRAFSAGPPAAFPMGTPKHKSIGTAALRLSHQVLVVASARYESGRVGTSDSNVPVPATKFATLDLGAIPASVSRLGSRISSTGITTTWKAFLKKAGIGTSIYATGFRNQSSGNGTRLNYPAPAVSHRHTRCSRESGNPYYGVLRRETD
jgi:hypothetical protein